MVNLRNYTEEVDIRVVHGEVNEDDTRTPIDPQIVEQAFQPLHSDGFILREIEVVTTSPVNGHGSPMEPHLQKVPRGEFPPKNKYIYITYMVV